jgi:hypothetical protein
MTSLPALPRDEQWVYGLLCQALAVVFVDLMRMLYVASSDVGRRSNEHRYGEFIDVGERHFADLRSLIANHVAGLDGKAKLMLSELERRLSWALGRLKMGPDLHGHHGLYFTNLRMIGTGLHAYCSATMREDYQQRASGIISFVASEIDKRGIATNLSSLDSTVSLRLAVQSHMLREAAKTGTPAITSIVHDMDQHFALTYFLIDYALLCRMP